MFVQQQPAIQVFKVFTEMPAEFRRTGERSEWADINRGGASLDSFLEGPVFDVQGNLYVTDIIFGRIFKVDAKGAWTLVVEYDGEPNGMKFFSDNELLITDYKNGLGAFIGCGPPVSLTCCWPMCQVRTGWCCLLTKKFCGLQ